ncbi:MAG TPA: hypothetical protein VG944_15470 [Fimbriimonas sp.]|nr:hypothetical protein [Fimbriimonas sp.]
MARANRRPQPSKKAGFPWLLFLLFVASVYLFWVLPYQLGTPVPKVKFGNDVR